MAEYPDPTHAYDCPLCDWHVRAGAEHAEWFRAAVVQHERFHAFTHDRRLVRGQRERSARV